MGLETHAESREVTVYYTATFTEVVEVPADWEWDGKLDSILEYTDLPYSNGSLDDWEVCD